MSMNLLLPVLALVAIVVVSGCTTQETQTEPTLEESIQEMMEFMENNPNDLTPTAPAGDLLPGRTDTKSGMFENINYMTSGTASIQEENGKAFIVFGFDFSTPAGPDLVVYLTSNSGPTTRADLQAGLEVAQLKSTTGEQIYPLPAGTDLTQYNSVTIHCKRFNVPWSYAPLT